MRLELHKNQSKHLSMHAALHEDIHTASASHAYEVLMTRPDAKISAPPHMQVMYFPTSPLRSLGMSFNVMSPS